MTYYQNNAFMAQAVIAPMFAIQLHEDLVNLRRTQITASDRNHEDMTKLMKALQPSSSGNSAHTLFSRFLDFKSA
jgi:hypothetical protein